MPRHLEQSLVILSEAKDLLFFEVWRFFATLRMTKFLLRMTKFLLRMTKIFAQNDERVCHPETQSKDLLLKNLCVKLFLKKSFYVNILIQFVFYIPLYTQDTKAFDFKKTISYLERFLF
jgi:hypothetical protein